MKIVSTRLVEHDGNRHNNYTVFRIIFAWMVLFDHAFFIQKTEDVIDPFYSYHHGFISLGGTAVNGFFAISGFLVAASFENRGIVDYTISRVLRVFPALIICIISTVFILGPLLTTLSISEYFSASETYVYLQNIVVVLGMKWYLPGVFDNNPMADVNGSLWTITTEVRCYILLAFMGVFGVLRNKILANVCIMAILLVGIFVFPNLSFLGSYAKWSRLALYFFIGFLFYINRDKVIFDIRIATLVFLGIVFLFAQNWFKYFFPLLFVYLLFYLVYQTKFINVDAKLGDISYGTYIYAWPVQQFVAFNFPGFTPYGNIALSTTIVFTLAFFSWHWIEKPMLSIKYKLVSIKR